MFDMLEYRVFADVPEAPQTEPQRQLFFAELCHREVEKLTTQLGHAPVAVTQTLGCQMNARDSEKINGIFKTAGFVLGTDEEKADYVIYNTCTVRENANLKVYGRLGYLHSLKNHKPHLKIALCGCMMQEPQVIEKIRESYSFVNLIFGTHNIYKFAELLYLSLTEKKQVIDIWEGTDQIVEDLPIDRKYAFKSGVNIMFGCDNFCSYCIVPYVRGRERSRLPEDIIHEIEGLVADGVVEVMLLGQNVNSYGKGLKEKIDFAGLLRRIEQIDGLRRIRFMTSHPKDLSDDVIAVMAASKKICRQLHLPFQAGSTNILKKMRRQYTKEQYLALVDRVKAAIPDISLSTDIMVGFPEESEEDFQDTLDVVRKVGFDHAFTFIYSKRSNTPAAANKNQVPEDVVKNRFERLLHEVQQRSRSGAARLTGVTAEVLVEELNLKMNGYVTGRLDNNMVVHFPGGEELIGRFCRVSLDECKGFYFIGERVADE